MENVAALMSMGASAAQAGQASVNGVSFPLADKWVLTPQEQAEIKTAIDAYNNIIKTTATAAGLAFFDANQFMQQCNPAISNHTRDPWLSDPASRRVWL